MKYQLLHENESEDLITRLLKVRRIDDNIDSFLHPKISDYRLDPFLLNDMEKAVDRIILAMQRKEKIMIFGDYDVDGITSSYIVYKFITKYLNYKNISIQYPDRIKDGYGMKKSHIDDLKSKWIDVIITVDNGITAINEALYAKEQGIDLIITDHHQVLASVPEAFAVVNPQVSPDYPFKGLAGVGVAFKLICALLTKSNFDPEKRNQIFNYFLPIVTIGTVADIVPLVHENRAMVKKWLELMNLRDDNFPSSIRWFLKHLNIKESIDTYHIGFLIGPRINAGGRIKSPYDSLNALMYSGDVQLPHLERLEEINTERRKMQEDMFKHAEAQINCEKKILIAHGDHFHEGIVGIVSGRITEKYNKPSMILKVNAEKNLGTASLRGPSYFSVIDMIKSVSDILERFGGHRWAWGLGVKLENLDTLIERLEAYCDIHIKDEDLEKSLSLDTKIYPQEWNQEELTKIQKLAPFGEGNKEPTFLLENIKIIKIESVWKKEKTHMKIYGLHGDNKISAMFWKKWDEIESLRGSGEYVNLIGKVKNDTFNGGYYLDGISWEC